jgi:hypothetical protein
MIYTPPTVIISIVLHHIRSQYIIITIFLAPVCKSFDKVYIC